MQWRQRCSGRECRDGSGTLARECTPKIRGWATRSQRHSRHGLWRRGGDKEGSRVVAGIIARGAHTATAGCDGCVTLCFRGADVRAVTLWDSEAHLTHRVLSLLNTFLRVLPIYLCVPRCIHSDYASASYDLFCSSGQGSSDAKMGGPNSCETKQPALHGRAAIAHA